MTYKLHNLKHYVNLCVDRQVDRYINNIYKRKLSMISSLLLN